MKQTTLFGELIQDAPILIELIDRQPYSAIEIEARERAVQASLRNAGIAESSIGTDRKTGIIDVVLALAPGLSIDDVLEAIPYEDRSDLVVSVVDGVRTAPENASFGGMRSELADGTKWCMFSWSVVNLTSGITGVASADHCGDHAGINHPGYSTHDIDFRAGVQGEWGDVAWWTTPKPAPAQFYADVGGVIRDVTSTEPLSGLQEGEPVCIFSRVQAARRCDADIMDISRSCTGLGHMVWMNADVTTGGDSGAGWSFNFRAFGTHHGDCVIGSDRWSIFSPVYSHDQAINVAVRVAP